jgi:hypothetical protein
MVLHMAPNQSLKLTAEAEAQTRCPQENEFLSAYTPPV